MLDTLRHVETPEGVELTLVVAGPFARAQAWAIDSAIKLALLIAAGTIAAVFRSLGQGAFFVERHFVKSCARDSAARLGERQDYFHT